MSQDKLKKIIARLETQNDMLLTELQELDSLMRTIGFIDGIATVKATAEEIIAQDDQAA